VKPPLTRNCDGPGLKKSRRRLKPPLAALRGPGRPGGGRGGKETLRPFP